MSSTSTNRFFFGRRVGCSRAEHIFGARCSNEAYLFEWRMQLVACMCMHSETHGLWKDMASWIYSNITQMRCRSKKWQVIWCSSMDRLITSIQAGAAAELWETILSQLRDDFRRIQVQRAAQSRVALNSLQMDVATLARIMMDGSFAIQGPKQTLHWQCQKNPELTTWQNQETI